MANTYFSDLGIVCAHNSLQVMQILEPLQLIGMPTL